MTVQEVQLLIRQNMVLYRNSAKPLTDADAATLVAAWSTALADIPSAPGKQAFNRALTVCHFPVTLADIFDQLRTMQAQNEPKAADYWAVICEKARQAANNKTSYAYTARLPDGRTEGQAAKDANRQLFAELPDVVQDYFGNLQALLDFEADDATARSYRRRDFEKFYADRQHSRPLDPLKLPCTAPKTAISGTAVKKLAE